MVLGRGDDRGRDSRASRERRRPSVADHAADDLHGISWEDAPVRRKTSSSIPAWLLAVGLAFATSSACAPTSFRPSASAPNAIDRGELFETGGVVFDAWFRSVHDLHAELATATLEDRDNLAKLARAVGVVPTAEREQLLARLAKVAAGKPRMELVIAQPDEIEATLAWPEGKKPRGEEAALSEAVLAVANAELKLALRMSELPMRAHRVLELGEKLERSARKDLEQFPPARRREIQSEAERARKLLGWVATEAPRERDRVREFVRGMIAALKQGR